MDSRFVSYKNLTSSINGTKQEFFTTTNVCAVEGIQVCNTSGNNLQFNITLVKTENSITTEIYQFKKYKLNAYESVFLNYLVYLGSSDKIFAWLDFSGNAADITFSYREIFNHNN